MVTSHENKKMMMGGLGIAASVIFRGLGVRRESSDLHPLADLSIG